MNFTSFPELISERLILRRPEMNDTDDLFLLRTDASVNEFIERPLPLTKEDIEYFIKKIWKGIENDGWLYWAITIKGDNKFAGTICYWNIK